MWKLTARAQRAEPIHGVPWRDLTDEEFKAASALMDERFPGDPGSLERSGFFEKVATGTTGRRASEESE